MTEQEILTRIREAYRRILGDNLVGIYLHGSLAFGCYRREVSDIDILVVTEHPPSLAEKKALIAELLALDPYFPPKGIEMSLVTAAVCRPFVYPTPYELHYSSTYRSACLADPEAHCRAMHGTDRDLAAHFTVTREVGRVICGQPIPEVFAPVPREAYLDSICFDVENAISEIAENPVYLTLNLCRVLAYVREGVVLSKAQGGEWGLRTLPTDLHPVIRAALDAYRGEPSAPSDPHANRRFAARMLSHIFANKGERHPMKPQIPFHSAEILLPRSPDSRWAVVACDQYTSEPAYWEQVRRITENTPSTYHLVLPEIYLKEADTQARIGAINQTMRDYTDSELLAAYEDAMILVERTLVGGRTRWGIVGAVDLDAYDYEVGKQPLIRATEGTVLERIPPRVAIRKDASLELPHVMLLIDDPKRTVIEPLKDVRSTPIYDLELMQNGGHIRGYLLGKDAQQAILAALGELCEGQDSPMLFAVGDGNHSLATAKACAALDPENPLAARALVEVVNIHDPALDFEPIYRVLFGVDPEDVMAEARKHFTAPAGETVTLLAGDKAETVYATGLISDAVQTFLDGYLARHPQVGIDYIHGEDVVRALSGKEHTVGFLFPGIAKSELFPYVRENGALPRKTFSMGEANDKRFYLEARRIKERR